MLQRDSASGQLVGMRQRREDVMLKAVGFGGSSSQSQCGFFLDRCGLVNGCAKEVWLPEVCVGEDGMCSLVVVLVGQYHECIE